MELLLPFLVGVLVPLLLVVLVPRANLWAVVLLGVLAAVGWWLYLMTHNDSKSEPLTSGDILVLQALFLIVWAAGAVLGRQIRRGH
jgi:hypothetical protein